VGLIGVINSVLLQDVVGAQGLAPLPGGTRRAKIAVRGLRDLIVYLIWQYVKNNFKGNAGHDLLEDSQMSLRVYWLMLENLFVPIGNFIFAQVVPIGNIYAVMCL